MMTFKRHINIILPASIYAIIKKLAGRDKMTVATKALELLQGGLEFEEDELLSNIVVNRDTKKSTFVSHKKTWL